MLHYHQHHEIYYLLSGTQRCFIDNAYYDMKAGDFALIKENFGDIKTLDSTRACGVGCCTERWYRYHLTAIALHEVEVHIILRCSIWGIRLNIDPIYTVKEVEIINIYRTCKGLHRCKYIRYRYTH